MDHDKGKVTPPFPRGKIVWTSPKHGICGRERNGR